VVSKLDPGVMPMIVDGSMFTGWDTDAYARKIDCPILLEHGDRSLGSAIYPGEMERITALMKDVEVLHIPGTGHAPQFDARDRLFEALRRFIEEA
jgi:pimeloyl-ACP methyl ester carboxylesterase